MKNQHFTISREAIRRASRMAGRKPHYLDEYNGIVTIKLMENGVERVIEYSWEEINEAAAKAFGKYGKKL
ncbi:hypothetical protein [Chitinophaga sp. Cy-1792]|uniref:hypothetical protein n=1 Tax=Chitinophaga sp. Cy-1792 TaxID=2608339 RepID=UPI00141FF1FA|nr:hypothetical protein [Chitinophaga sp. Cy-1792]NIG52876.1 hypothetical protein [Chitinophaga sp. Cy-1792]